MEKSSEPFSNLNHDSVGLQYLSDDNDNSDKSESNSSSRHSNITQNVLTRNKRGLSDVSHITEIPWNPSTPKGVNKDNLKDQKFQTTSAMSTYKKILPFFRPKKKSIALPLNGIINHNVGHDNYYPNKKISTFDTLPNLEHYKNIFSLHKAKSRPSLTELHEDIGAEYYDKDLYHYKVEDIEDKSPVGPPSAATEKVRGISQGPKFGWIKGVLLRCILNIWGVMLFLRLSWIVGQAGIGYATLIVILSVIVVSITSMSMSAICTNGEVKGGGAYYMISRSLGPEFGGAIGVVFSIASTVAVSMNVVGLAETVVDLIGKHGAHLFNVISPDNWIRIVGCVTAILLLIIVIAGMEWEAKAQVFFLILLLLAFLNYFLGTVLPIPQSKKAKGLLGYQGSLFLENFLPDFQKGASFFSMFSIYFPSATGILAGANISGDLKDAQKSIPKGTFMAILITGVSYIFMIWTFGSVMLREASGNISDLYAPANASSYEAGRGVSRRPLSISELESRSSPLRQCFHSTTAPCKYGLLNDYQAAEMISYVGPIITAGIFSATLSSALACLVGASKVFQALCRDKIFPGLEVLAKGSKKNDDPYRLYVLAFFIAVLFILIGDLNLIAPIISNFYLMAYALINYSCFDASISNSIGFRPGFKYFNPWVSLLGGFLCVMSMFLIKWWATLITFIFIFALYGYIRYKKPDINWGSSTQAHVYKNALTFLYKLNQTEEHVKNFRPQILALTGDPRTRPAFLDFAALFTKSLSLLICGNIIKADPKECLSQLDRALMYKFFQSKGTKAMYNTIMATNFRQGARALLQLSGLGRMRPNVLLLGYKGDWRTSKIEFIVDYFNIIHDTFDLRLNIGILRMPFGLYVPIDDENDSYPSCRDMNGDATMPLSPTKDRIPFELDNDMEEDFLYSAQSDRDQIKFGIDKHKTSKLFPHAEIQIKRTDEDSPKDMKFSPKAIRRGIIQKSRNITDLTSKSILPIRRKSHKNGLRGNHIDGGGEINPSYNDTENVMASVKNNSPTAPVVDNISLTSSKVRFVSKDKKGLWNKNKSPTRAVLNSSPHSLSPHARSKPGNKRGRKKSKKLSRALTQYYTIKRLSLGPGILQTISDEERTVLEDYYNTYFTVRQKRGTIDVWWLYDDGGLTILLPYIISQRRNWQKCKVRFFALSNDSNELDLIHHSFVAMLTKFRIDFSDVYIIPDISKLPYPITQSRFERMIEPFRVPDTSDPNYKEGMITDAEYSALELKSLRHMRLHELLRKHSTEANLIVITLPIPRKATCSAAMYMAWLEIMSQNLPPILMVRGNQQSVLTFYS